MKRLTDRYKGMAYIKGFQCQLRGVGIEEFNAAVEKLAAYEDAEEAKNELDVCPNCGAKMEKLSELKPCPFCGETEMDLMEDTPQGCITEYFVSCSCCGAQVANDESMKDAIALWNQRV